VITPPGQGRKRKLSMAASRFLRRQVLENHRVTVKDLLKILAMKRLNNFETAEVIKSCISS